jgi:diguanylate cyclase (GGDEF)-like protein
MLTHLTRKSRSSTLWLKAFVMVVCFAIIALEGWRDWSEREDEFVRIQTEMKNLAKSLAQHAEDTFNLADAILTDVVDRMEQNGSTPAAAADLERFLVERSQTLQSVKVLTIYGEDGLLLSSSLPGHSLKVNGSGQAFFQHHRASADRKWFFGTPIRDPLGSDWILSISRRFNKPDGSFGGVVQISVPPRYFVNFFSRFNIGEQGTITLFHSNGMILSRSPYIEKAIGTGRTSMPWAEDGRTSGSYEYVSPIDNVSRLGGYQRNHVYPVVVLTAVSRDEALARWNREFMFRTFAVGSLVAVKELRRREIAEFELAILATTDGLTGLANRRSFDRQIETEWLRAARDGTPLSLLLIDVDQFKAYNDIYGHQAGDTCLRMVAEVFSQAINRPGDLVARYGGEEMAVLMPDTDDVGAAAVAENIRARVEALALRHEANPPSGILTISIGSATRIPAFDRSGTGAKELVALADKALYCAKQDGRNRISAAKAA